MYPVIKDYNGAFIFEHVSKIMADRTSAIIIILIYNMSLISLTYVLK